MVPVSYPMVMKRLEPDRSDGIGGNLRNNILSEAPDVGIGGTQ